MKKRIISLALALNLLLGFTSCGKREKHNTHERSATTSITDEVSEFSESESIIEEVEDEKIREIPIDEFINNINNIDIVYNYEEYYPDLEDVMFYKNCIQNNKKCTNKESDYNKLFELIRQNTINKYGKANNVFMVPNEIYTDQEISDLNTKGVSVAIALSNILEDIFKNGSNDILEDYCRLKDISIVIDNNEQESSQIALGEWFEESLTIYIYYENIQKVWESLWKDDDEKLNDDYEFYRYIYKIVKHEVDHARQSFCSCRREKTQSELKFINNDILNMRSKDLYLSFITESSAEALVYYGKNLMETSESLDYEYYKEREFEILLFLLSVFRDNREADEYYNAILDGDLEDFFKFFDLNSDQEILKFYKILYSMDTLSVRNNLASKIADGREKMKYIELEKQVGYSYLGEIFKNSIIDLITSSNENNLELEECVMLYLYTKSYITDIQFTGYFEKDEENHNIRIYDNDFARIVLAVESEFNDFLCSKYNLSKNGLKQMLEDDDYESRLCDFEIFLMNNGYYYCEYQSSFDKLLKKYPLLYNISWTKTNYYDSIQYFNEYVKKRYYSK